MIESLLEATRDHLIAEIEPLDHNYVGVRPEGHPPATMADFYISIDEVSVQSADKASLKEIYTIAVWLTVRPNVLPDDRQEDFYLANARGLSRWEREVISKIHASYPLMQRANKLLGLDNLFGSGGFTQPLFYQGRRATNFATGWVPSDSETDKAECMVRMLTFAGGNRLQNLETVN